jgi:hypothetical protein
LTESLMTDLMECQRLCEELRSPAAKAKERTLVASA